MAIDRAAGGRYSSLFDTGELEILEGEAEQQGETGEVFDEADVEELASRLLDVGNEAEFDRLLGGMISHAAQQVGEELSAPLGRAVGGLLKSLAKQALPPAGTTLGGGASSPAHMLGMELEGLGEVEADFECAKQFVRLAGEAVRNAVESEPLGIPAHVAEAAVTTAAKVYAPALPISPAPSAASPQPRRTGRWVRRGDRIIALDADPTA
jgi:hypothetical protein